MNHNILNQIWQHKGGVLKSEIKPDSIFIDAEKDLSDLVKYRLVRFYKGRYYCDLPF